MKKYFLNFEKKKMLKKKFKKRILKDFFFQKKFIFEIFPFSGVFRKNGENVIKIYQLEQILRYSPLLEEMICNI